MIIKKLELVHFRNYKEQVIDVHPGINVFFGDNAQGKTNILEAIYMCACARSHRTAKDIDIIERNEDFYKIKILFEDKHQLEEEIEMIFMDAVHGHPERTRSRRVVNHNGLRLSKIGDLMGLFHAVIFAPEDLMIVKEGPSVRRRYIDLLISQVRPSYFSHLQQYSQLVSQRNQLLKQFRHQRRNAHNKLNESEQIQIEIWDEALADHAAAIIVQRRNYAERIHKWSEITQHELSIGKEKLNVKYKSVPGIDYNIGEKELSEAIKMKLKTNLYDDIEKGITSSGPHRDDLEISLNGDQIKPYASQGQQRSAVLSLKIAELHILREEIGEAPVLLLDDVMSELDENRRSALLNHIEQSQIFVTCTDASHITESMKSYYDKFNPDICDDNGSDDQHERMRCQNIFSYYEVKDGQIVSCEIQSADH